MQRTTATGNVANKFTNGNPSTGTPATNIDAPWLNNVQEEICNAVTGAGLTLDATGTVQNQLLAAIQALVQQGASPNPQKSTVGNNQVTPANITGLVYDHTLYKAARILFSIHRATDTGIELEESGQMWAVWQPVAAKWRLEIMSLFDDCGIVFTMTTAGQIQYTSSNLSCSNPANYVGELRVSDVALLNL